MSACVTDWRTACELNICGHVDSDVRDPDLHGGMTPMDAGAIFEAMACAWGSVPGGFCYVCHQALEYDLEAGDA